MRTTSFAAPAALPTLAHTPSVHPAPAARADAVLSPRHGTLAAGFGTAQGSAFFLPGPSHTAQAARNKGCWRFFKGFWRNLLLKKQA
jgi:hypothetical protein